MIDDFGRQRMRIEELLNRWIVPLERRYDFLNMPNGKKIQVPFDQLIIFSTNLEPRDLVDEAFLRRIPYKIEVFDPSLEEFKGLFCSLAKKMGFPDRPEAVEHLIQKHYAPKSRPFRYCHPRDILMQIRNLLQLQGLPAGDHRRVHRHGGGELFRRDVKAGAADLGCGTGTMLAWSSRFCRFELGIRVESASAGRPASAR